MSDDRYPPTQRDLRIFSNYYHDPYHEVALENQQLTEDIAELRAENDALRAELEQAHSAARILANLDAAAEQRQAWDDARGERGED